MPRSNRLVILRVQVPLKTNGTTGILVIVPQLFGAFFVHDVPDYTDEERSRKHRDSESGA